jgi:GT2 family glycosyltransferase
VLDAVAGQLPLRVVREPTTGLGRARNTGWRAARADIVAFVDDDCRPAPDLIAQLLDVFAAHPQVGFLGGRVLCGDPRDAPLATTTRRRPMLIRSHRFVPAGLVHGANLAFLRRVLEEIDGFDERLGAGTDYPCEDMEAVGRAVWSGVTGLFHPGPTVYHVHGRRDGAEVERALKAYDIGRGAYYARLWAYPGARSRTAGGWLTSTVVGTMIQPRWGRIGREVRAFRTSRRTVPPRTLAEPQGPSDSRWLSRIRPNG